MANERTRVSYSLVSRRPPRVRASNAHAEFILCGNNNFDSASRFEYLDDKRVDRQPSERLVPFNEVVRRNFRRSLASSIYGTVSDFGDSLRCGQLHGKVGVFCWSEFWRMLALLCVTGGERTSSTSRHLMIDYRDNRATSGNISSESSADSSDG